MGVKLGHFDPDAGLWYFDIPGGGRAWQLHTGKIEWKNKPLANEYAELALLVDGRIVCKDTIPAPRGAEIDTFTAFRFEDALGFEYAYAGFFGKKRA